MLKRIFLPMLIVCMIGIVACSSGNNNANSSDTTSISSPEGMGADTTSAKTNSLRDSLNR